MNAQARHRSGLSGQRRQAASRHCRRVQPRDGSGLLRPVCASALAPYLPDQCGMSCSQTSGVEHPRPCNLTPPCPGPPTCAQPPDGVLPHPSAQLSHLPSELRQRKQWSGQARQRPAAASSAKKPVEVPAGGEEHLVHRVWEGHTSQFGSAHWQGVGREGWDAGVAVWNVGNGVCGCQGGHAQHTGGSYVLHSYDGTLKARGQRYCQCCHSTPHRHAVARGIQTKGLGAGRAGLAHAARAAPGPAFALCGHVHV